MVFSSLLTIMVMVITFLLVIFIVVFVVIGGPNHSRVFIFYVGDFHHGFHCK